jgi:hypothetical protein
MRGQQTLKTLYLVFLLLLGLGYVAVTPPFEGFDEFAHYSSLRQIAHTGRIPVLGASYLDQEVVDYQGPLPYGSGVPPFRPPLHASSYEEFFSNPQHVEDFINSHGGTKPRSRFRESEQLNWQAQHPPLYYLIMSPLVRVTDQASLPVQVFALRYASYLLAMGGVLFGIATINGRKDIDSSAWLGFLLYPLLLPQVFPEFARIGNDSLCLFLLGYLFFAMFSHRADRALGTGNPWLIGLVLGLGMWTKAFFIPIAAAIVTWVVLCQRTRPAPGKGPAYGLDGAIKIVFAALLTGGWWYGFNLWTRGEITGAYDAALLSQSDGLIAGLIKNFSFFELARGIAVVPVTWTWAGTWSLARMPSYLQLPVVLLMLWVALEFVVQLRRYPLQHQNWLLVLMFAWMGLGFVHHALVILASSRSGVSISQPGWYLHIFLPWVAVGLGVGIQAILSRPVTKSLFTWLTAYALLFHLAAIWSEVSLFSGCATKGADKQFHFQTPAFCLDQAPLVIQRLGVLAFPTVAMFAFSLAAACGLWMIRMTMAGSANSAVTGQSGSPGE